jgi:hypothetical protein
LRNVPADAADPQAFRPGSVSKLFTERVDLEDVPALRIIDDPLWQSVQDRLLGIRDSEGVRKARATRFWEHRHARHLLSSAVPAVAR